LSNGKSPGSDGIPSEFYKYTLNDSINVIEALFNRILNKGLFPKIWGKSVATAIHKSGLMTLVTIEGFL
jgi:hypothetical protein